ncbi:energy transducer TonB [Desulfobacterota bacterium M19]
MPKPAVKKRQPPPKTPVNQVKEALPTQIAALPRPRHTALKLSATRPQPADITPRRIQAAARSQPRRTRRLIEKVAPNGSRTAAVVRKTIETKESTVKHSGEANDKIRQEYLRLVRTRIERHKKYPGRARIRWLQGEVTIRLCLTPAGKTQNLAVSKSSGREILDQAALQAVRDAAPFPRPPEKIFKGKITLELKIIFKLT